MVILSSTITISIGLVSFIGFLILVAMIAVFITLNVIHFRKYQKKTKDDYPINYYYKKLYNSLFYCGLILVPLFKNVILDARKYIAFYKKKDDIEYAIHMWGGVDEKPELVGVIRTLKMLQLKYSQENFVNRKVFRIFVSK